MTIRSTISSNLPSLSPANLFLDDLEEIASIACRFAGGQDDSSHTADPEIALTFTCGTNECTSLEEVPLILKPLRAFSIETEGPAGIVLLRCSPFGARLHDAGLAPDKQLSLHHAVSSVFHRRKRHIAAFVRSLPVWFVLTFLALIGVTDYRLTVLMSKLGKPVPRPHLGDVLVMGAITLGFLFVARHTKLSPRKSFDASPTKKYIADKILPIIFGLAAGIAGTLLTQYLSRLIWPHP